MKERIPIFFATDDAYFKYLAVTLASIEENASDSYIYDVKILTSGLSQENTEAVAKLSYPHLKLQIVNVNEKMKRIRSNVAARLRDYYSESIFYRIFIPSLFPSIKRAVYLDCDIVLTDDVAKLYSTDIGDNVLGAVRDESIAPIPEFVSYVSEVIGAPDGEYFNSGVLLINAERFREEEIERQLVELIERYNFKTVAPDQDYLNFLCRGKVYYFDEGWNKQPFRDKNFPTEKIHLIHYNMFSKPWHYLGVTYEEYFWAAAKRTPYYKELLRERAEYSDEKKQSDAQCAERLVLATLEILNEKCSFCHVIDRGALLASV